MYDSKQKAEKSIDVFHILSSHYVYLTVSGTESAKNKTPFGQEFTTLTSGGVKKEGEEVSGFHETPEQAIEAYMAKLQEFCKERDAVIFRRAPLIEEGEKGFVVYSRLAAFNV